MPPGQVLTAKWPVLTYGESRAPTSQTWTFRCFGPRRAGGLLDVEGVPRAAAGRGHVRHPLRDALEPVRQPVGGSRRLARSCAARACGRRPSPSWPTAEGGYTTNISLADLRDDDALLAFQARRSRTSPPGARRPCRLVVPKLYFWKSAKWIRRSSSWTSTLRDSGKSTATTCDADPWKEERYSDQETDAMQRMRSESSPPSAQPGGH